jgi:hypothetical protein
MESYTEKGKVSIELSQKVWACYESQLYKQIMTPLSQLYYLSYVDFASKLKYGLYPLDILPSFK